MDIQELKSDIKRDAKFAERAVRNEIETIRNILNQLENNLDNDNLHAESGLQGNEWRLTLELSKLVQLKNHIKQLDNIE